MTRRLVLPLLLMAGCGSNASDNWPDLPCSSPTLASPTDPNTTPLVVDSGPTGGPGYTNGVFAKVTLCVPGSTTACQTIDHLLVDTGSIGVRVLESVLNLELQPVTSNAGYPLAECTPFVDGTAWGPVRSADVYIGGELASNIPIQAIGDEKTFTQVPSSCTGTPINNLKDLGSNGILGVGIHKQDCGLSCTSPIANAGLYYECASSTSCVEAAVPLEKQVPNPVAMFPVDNNGVIIQLPCIPSKGAPSATGALVFGIGTQANNALGAAKVIPGDSRGFVTTQYPPGAGLCEIQTESGCYTSFLDSGSNGLFFLDTRTTGISQCTAKGLTDFYCPSSKTLSQSAKIFGSGSIEGAPVEFIVANTAALSKSPNYAFDDIAGPMPGYPTDRSIPAFDWGLPFYFGRAVFTAIEGQPTPAGPGPYFAF